MDYRIELIQRRILYMAEILDAGLNGKAREKIIENQTRLIEISEEIEMIKEAGYINGSIYIKEEKYYMMNVLKPVRCEGKYLEKIKDSDQNKRIQFYIGLEPSEAKEQIKRFKRLEDLEWNLERLSEITAALESKFRSMAVGVELIKNGEFTRN